MPTCMLLQALPKFCCRGRACFQRQRPVRKEKKSRSRAGNLKTSFKKYESWYKQETNRINSFNMFQPSWSQLFLFGSSVQVCLFGISGFPSPHSFEAPVKVERSTCGFWTAKQLTNSFYEANLSGFRKNQPRFTNIFQPPSTSFNIFQHLPTSSNIFNSQLKLSEIQVAVVKFSSKHHDPSAEVCSSTPLVPGTTGEGLEEKMKAFHLILAASEQKDVSLKFRDIWKCWSCCFLDVCCFFEPCLPVSMGNLAPTAPDGGVQPPGCLWDHLKLLVTKPDLTLRVCPWKEGTKKT